MSRLRAGLCLVVAFACGALLSSLPTAGAKEDADAAVGARAYFSPGGDIEPAILEAIKEARQEIVVAMFTFTSRPLAEALVRAKQRGVDVKVILDRSQAYQKYGKLYDLERGKVDVRLMKLGKTSDNHQIRFHHKFMVVDRAVVTTGSFNWTSQADEENYENEMIVVAKKLATEFRDQFEKCWGDAEEPSSRSKGKGKPPAGGNGGGGGEEE